MFLVAYRHGLRVSEVVDLRWDQVELRADIDIKPAFSGNRRPTTKLTPQRWPELVSSSSNSRVGTSSTLR
jgi:integrase